MDYTDLKIFLNETLDTLQENKKITSKIEGRIEMIHSVLSWIDLKEKNII
jgi:hypothetical protein